MSPRSFLRIILPFVFTIFFVNQTQALAIADQFRIDRHLGTKTPYWTEFNGTQTPSPDGCGAIPIHFNFLSRHGSRQPTKGDTKQLEQLSKDLIKYGPRFTNTSFSWMSTWKNTYSPAFAGELDHLGEIELYNMSKRFLQRYPDLFTKKYNSVAYPIRTTEVSRTSRSGNAFGYGLWEGTGELGPCNYETFFLYSVAKKNDSLLRFWENCPNFTKVEEDPKTIEQSTLYLKSISDALVTSVKAILGIGSSQDDWQVTIDDVILLYTACSFDVAISGDTKFCAAFSDRDILQLEYASDLEDYYVRGPGSPVGTNVSCPLLIDFFAVMDKAIASPFAPEEESFMRFAHAETILPFLTYLGVIQDSHGMMWDTPWEEIENRTYRTSLFSPFASNVAFLLYSCENSTKFRVKLLRNEVEMMFPGCDEMYCPYDKLKMIYQEKLKCNYNEICGNFPAVCPQVENLPSKDVHVTVLTVVIVGVTCLISGIVGTFLAMRFYDARQKKAKYGRLELDASDHDL